MSRKHRRRNIIKQHENWTRYCNTKRLEFFDCEQQIEDKFSDIRRGYFREAHDEVGVLLMRVRAERQNMIEKVAKVVALNEELAKDNLFLKQQLKQITRSDYITTWAGCMDVTPTDEEIAHASEAIKQAGGLRNWREELKTVASIGLEDQSVRMALQSPILSRELGL